MRLKGRRSGPAKRKSFRVKHAPGTAERRSVTPSDASSTVDHENNTETSVDTLRCPPMSPKAVRSASVMPEAEDVTVADTPNALDKSFVSDVATSPVRCGRKGAPRCQIALYLLRRLEEGCWQWRGNVIWNEAVEEEVTELSSQAMRSLALRIPAKLDELNISPSKKSALLRKLEVAEIRRRKKEWGDSTINYAQASFFKVGLSNNTRTKRNSDRKDETLKKVSGDSVLNGDNNDDTKPGGSVSDEEAREILVSKRIQSATSRIYSQFIARASNDISKEELSSLVDSVKTAIRILSKYDVKPNDIFVS
ncbi:unnamed protein product [Anisakis simplex]|uniref:Uncharacterized protein n=1 Tax=Anisakis simplex TaxID=6269 RepID=A0A0M3J097_ANISI|nr:unnamed protein product [Anisakis simplex]